MAAQSARDWARWLIVACGAALMSVLIAQIGPARIAALLAALGVNFIAIVAIFSCHECVRAVALGVCMGPERRPSYRQLLRVRFIGEAVAAVTRTGPFGSEPTRAFALAQRADRAAHAVGTSASELVANS